MPLKPANSTPDPLSFFEAKVDEKAALKLEKTYAEIKDSRILYQGLTQACIQSMPLGQFASNAEDHLKNVMAAVEALAVFILDRSK